MHNHEPRAKALGNNNNYISVSPRINEKGGGGFSGCTEYEIVSGGLVHLHTPFIV